MKPQKLFFILSILGILILLFISQISCKPIISGTIEKIYYGNNKISLYLKDYSVEIILFTNEFLDIKKGQNISVYGREEIYKSKPQIIADKIIVYESK